MTAWIDGSFIYSTSEAWLSAMRSFTNGTLKTDKTGRMPVKNTMRVPLFNNPVPHVMKTLSPERLFRKYFATFKRAFLRETVGCGLYKHMVESDRAFKSGFYYFTQKLFVYLFLMNEMNEKE